MTFYYTNIIVPYLTPWETTPKDSRHNTNLQGSEVLQNQGNTKKEYITSTI